MLKVEREMKKKMTFDLNFSPSRVRLGCEKRPKK
jgi:hypothetical protein